jgi:hypothetical protein
MKLSALKIVGLRDCRYPPESKGTLMVNERVDEMYYVLSELCQRTWDFAAFLLEVSLMNQVHAGEFSRPSCTHSSGYT